MCLNGELNQQPFGLQAGTQSTEPHQAGLFLHFFPPTLIECLLWTSYSAKYCGQEGNLTYLVLHLRPLMIWLLPAILPLNLLSLLHIPVVPHVPLPELVFRVVLCHLPSVHFVCHSPATTPNSLLSTPAGLTFLSFVVWLPLPQACSGITLWCP